MHIQWSNVLIDVIVVMVGLSIGVSLRGIWESDKELTDKIMEDANHLSRVRVAKLIALIINCIILYYLITHVVSW